MIRRSVVGALAAAGLLTACGTGVPPRTGDKVPPPAYAAAAAQSDWAQYFAQQGQTCTSTARGKKLQVTDTADVGAAWNTFAGMSFVVADQSVERVPGHAVVTANLRTLYSISKTGTLSAPPQSQTLAHYDVVAEDALVYPTIASLRAGISTTVDVHTSANNVRSMVRTGLEDLATDGSGRIKLLLTYRFTPVPAPAAIITPSGRYTDVIGLVRTVAVRVLNLPKPYARAFIKAYNVDSQPVTTWFARGVGPVQTIAGGVTLKLLSCTPAAAAS